MIQHWIIAFLFVLHRIDGLTVCESHYCKCRNSENGSLYVDCSFEPDVFQTDNIIPNATISLDLSRNNLTSIQKLTLIQSNSLEELLLNDNLLKEIFPNSFQLPYLKKLDLSNNELETVHPNFLYGIPKLEYLSLVNNKLKMTSQLSLSCLTNLKEIYLDGNDLGKDLQSRSLFDVNGYGLSVQIQTISMSRVNLSDVPEDFFKPVLCSETFKTLILSNNNLTKIPQMPYYLRYLDLSDNPIRNLSNNLWELIYVDTLKLNNLDITEVSKNTFTAIENLELERNSKLTNFSYLAFGRQILTDTYDFQTKTLSLRKSNFSTLDENLKVLFTKIERLDLQDNPWMCDCHLSWLADLTIAQDLIQDFRCAAPVRLQNMRINDLRPGNFLCPTTDVGRIAYEIGAIVGILLYTLLVTFTVIWVYVFLYKPGRVVNRQEYTQLN